MEWNTQTPWVASQRLASSEITGEAVVLNLNDGNFYGMNELATQVWNWIQQPRTVDQLTELLTSEYDVDAGTARGDVIRLLRELKERSLIEVAV